MSWNREMCIEDVLATLEASGRFASIVDGFQDIGAALSKPKPMVCVWAEQQQSPPLTETISGSYREDLEILVLGYVDAETPAEGRLALAAMERDLVELLLEDRTRDGWAFDTIKSRGTTTDEGIAVDDGMGTRRFAGLVTAFRASYFPLEQGDSNNVAHGSFFYEPDTDHVVTLGATDTLVEIDAPLSICDAAQIAPSSDGRVRYTGARTRKFLITASVTMQKATGSGQVEIFLAKNGTEIGSTRMSGEIRSDLYLEITTHNVHEVAYNDEISLQMRSSEVTGDFNVDRMIITMLPKLG